MDNIVVSFKNSLYEIMAERAISIVELSKEINADPSTLYKIFNTPRDVKLKTIMKLADYFKCSLEYLCGKTHEYVQYEPRPYVPFGVRIKEIIGEYGLIPYAFFSQIGLTPSKYYYWLSGGEPMLSGLEAMAKNLDIVEDKYDDVILNLFVTHFMDIVLSAKGWARVYDLQKTQANSKTAFIAMKFGSQTDELRKMIVKGIEDAGYVARIMDEIEHNHQIVPEMLFEIRNSRFVVAELSYHNNGAYYESGYAYGLGKEVIHICSEAALKEDLHFDVAQINTVTYKKIDEIPEKLFKRIKATII